MIQKALKFILKDRFGRNSSPNAFLNDQSRHELFTRSPSIFSNLKTSLREAYQRLRSKTSPVIGLTYLLPVGQMWGRSAEVAQCFRTFSIIGPHGPIFTRAVRNEQKSRAEGEAATR